MIPHPFIITPKPNFRVHTTNTQYLVNENSDLSTFPKHHEEVFKGFNE
jgi:hypothetical protein